MHPRHLRIEDYTYPLPDERIARYPLAQRDASKLLLYKDGHISEDTYAHLPQHIPRGTLMVFNQARVMNARLQFRKPTGGGIEVFCLAPHSSYADVQTAMQQRGSVLWECLVGGAAKWKDGMALTIECADPAFTLSATIKERLAGSYILAMQWSDAALTFAGVLHHLGQVPLPPYLRRPAEATDEATYQTVYARDEGSVAAPTAGLHFTPQVLDGLAANSVDAAFVTLHVGAGTFIPVKAETMDGHTMHAEWIEVTQATVQLLASRLGDGVVAVGTTSMRTIESLYWMGNKLLNGQPLHLTDIAVAQWDAYEAPATHPAAEALHALAAYMQAHDMHKLITRTQIIIAPGYTFRIVKGLVTNFHQPQSTLLLLVAALIGQDWRRVYDHALQHGYRFLSYGDGSLLWCHQQNTNV